MYLSTLSSLFHCYLQCTLRCVRNTGGAMLANFCTRIPTLRNSEKLREANMDSTCNSLQVSAGNVSHNSLVLRCTSHLHLERKKYFISLMIISRVALTVPLPTPAIQSLCSPLAFFFFSLAFFFFFTILSI